MKSAKGLLVAAAVAIAVVVPAVLLTQHQSHATNASARPSAAESALARQVAIQEATKLNPDKSAVATDDWPANVTSVSFALSTHDAAITLTGASGAPDNRAVLIIRLTGTFQVYAVSVPQGVSPEFTRHVLTLIVDAKTGAVLDYDAGESAPALPNANVLKAA
jgi:hypothetical protein